MVHQAFQKHHLKVRRLQCIAVVRGPGPFTAVRTGIIVANTLGWMLSIPVVGIVSERPLTDSDIDRLHSPQGKTFRPVRPAYGREPNITKPKR